MPVFFFIQYDLDVHSSRSFFCPAGRARLTQPDCGRCNAPAPSGKFSLLSQIRISHRLVVEESKCDSGLDKVFFCPAGRAQRRRWTTAGAMHLHPPGNSLCCRKFEFPIVWDGRINKSDIGPEKVWRMVCLLSQRSAG